MILMNKKLDSAKELAEKLVDQRYVGDSVYITVGDVEIPIYETLADSAERNAYGLVDGLRRAIADLVDEIRREKP